VGVSTRALAESAAAGGAAPVAVDFFGDRDQAPGVESYALQRDLGLPCTAEGLLSAAGLLSAEAVMYTANLENHPEVVRSLAMQREVLGNTPETLVELRDWRVLRGFCAEAGIAHPATLLRGEERQAGRGGRWLRKRVRSGGGHGVRPWDGEPLDDAHLLQAEVEGRAASAAFVADGRAARVFGLTEQLVGDPALGAHGCAWTGNILPLDVPGGDAGGLLDVVAGWASRLTRRFGLRGVNGLDFVLARAPGGALVPHLVEVNPRYTASMELAEHAYGINVFALHVEGLAGRLPGDVPAERQAAGFFGKAVVYARRTVVTPDTDAWLEQGVRDVPSGGERIAAGHPVCTVLALGAPDRRACLAELHMRAATMEEALQHGDQRREVRRE
jgi:predicted ATP-grasp superfamily ATP-dependent carboligase